MGEYVKSAIRSAEHIGATVVWTSLDRWLLVTNYAPEYRAWAARGVTGDTGPQIDAVTILRGATKQEFYRACATIDPQHYREELTQAGPQLVIPGCERRPIENGKPAQLGLFD